MENIVDVYDEVSVEIEDRAIIVKGPKGHVRKNFDDPRFNRLIKIEKHNDKIVFKAEDEGRKVKAMIGTMGAHLKNMMIGVTKGYVYTMKIVTTHFPITVAVSDKEVQIKNFFGEKNPRRADVVGNTAIKVDKEHVEVSGINLEEVSQTAANIERACKLKGRDRRIFQDGVYMYSRALQSGEKI